MAAISSEAPSSTMGRPDHVQSMAAISPALPIGAQAQQATASRNSRNRFKGYNRSMVAGGQGSKFKDKLQQKYGGTPGQYVNASSRNSGMPGQPLPYRTDAPTIQVASRDEMEVRRDPSLSNSPKVSHVHQKRKGESLTTSLQASTNAKSSSLLDSANFSRRARHLGKVHSTLELAPGAVYQSKDFSAIHGDGGPVRNVPIKSSKHTIKMLNPGYGGRRQAGSSYKNRSRSRSPGRSPSPGSGGSFERQQAALGGLPQMKIQKARKSTGAGSARLGSGSRLGSGRLPSARANAKYDNYPGAQYGRPAALKNSSSHANLGGSVTPMGLAGKPLPQKAAARDTGSKSSTNIGFYQVRAGLSGRNRSRMSHQHVGRGAPASPLRPGAEGGSRSLLRSQHGFGRDGKSQPPEPSRQTARASPGALRAFVEQNKDSSDDGDAYATVRELDKIAVREATPSATKRQYFKTGFDYRVADPTQDMNRWLARQQRKMAAVLGGDGREVARIKKTDTAGLLSKAASDLKLMHYKLSRCVTQGLGHFVALKVTTQQEIQTYIERVYASNAGRPGSRSNVASKGGPAGAQARAAQYHSAELDNLYPRTRLELLDQNPLNCVLYAEGRRGPAKCVFRGKIPDDLLLLVSETHQDPSPENATWTFTRPRAALFRPREQKSAPVAKASASSGPKQQALAHLFFKFTSAEDAKFSCEVTFPEEEEHQRRRRAQEPVGGYGHHGEEAKAPFKQKIAREVDDMVHDEDRAEAYLAQVKGVKALKQDRNRSAAGRETDFVQRNVERAEQAHPRAREAQLLTQVEAYKTRLENAKLKRKIIEQESTKFKVLQLNRWELLRAKKAEFREIVAEERKQQAFTRRWIQMAATRTAVGKIYAAFLEHRHQVFLHRYRVRMATRIQKAWARRRTARAGRDPAGRLRLTTRNALNVFAMHGHEDARSRAQATLLEFMDRSAGLEEFRSSAVNFLHQIKKISAVAHGRLNAHDGKKAFLKQYFMREVECMSIGAFKKAKKSKKYKMLHANLDLLKEAQIVAVLAEYFKMCKMVFRAISVIHYTWGQQHNLDMVAELC